MNRAQRREIAKKGKRAKMSEGAIKKYIAYLELRESKETIEQGTKVKINYDKIISDEGYENKTSEYKKTVEELKDKVCTVKYDELYTDTPCIVTLEEDTSEPKWLWFIKDLIICSEDVVC